ncbi:MAG: hypothetical protein J6B17_00705 [Ruminococcus sp.]|nr:hypothetical protein [Ruminococcus sp.]
MRKTKKLLSMLLGSMIAVSAVGSIRAEALAYFVDNPLEAPAGYVEYNDTSGLFAGIVNNNVYSSYIKFLDEDEESVEIWLYYDFTYNTTRFTVNHEKIAEFDAIYEKYSAELDMDYYKREGAPSNKPELGAKVIIFDQYDENGNKTKDPTVMESKQELISEMTAEMYKAGCLLDAEYSGMAALGMKGFHQSLVMFVNLNGQTAGSEIERLDEISAKYYDKHKVIYDGTETLDLYYVRVGFREADELAEEIKEVYPDASCDIGVFLNSAETVASGTTDLIAEIEETACDIDENGTVEITDATAILESYANTAAGIAAASAENPMDVNGDGAVGIDDATFVLTVYAELAAGMR